MKKKLIRFFNGRTNESGAVLIMFAIILPVLLGFMGLVIDVGYAYFVKREMQTAADAAAFARAHTLARGNTAYIEGYAKEESANKGFPESKVESIEVNWPPVVSTDFNSDNKFVEVRITQEIQTWFMGVISQDLNTTTVSALAVAGLIPDSLGDGCVYVLDKCADKAFEISSGSLVAAQNCGVKVYSCSDNALDVTSGSTLDAGSIDVYGGVEDGGGTISPAPDTFNEACPADDCGYDPNLDPLSDLAPPEFSNDCNYTDFLLSSQGTPENRITISPGVYCNCISVLSGSHVEFANGDFILMGGGLKIESNSTAVSATGGIGFYNTEGNGYDFDTINIDSNSIAQFTAQKGEGVPDSNPMKRVLFYQDRSIAGSYDNKIESNVVDTFFDGILYFPTQHLMFHSNTESAPEKDTIIVSATLEVSSGTSVLISTEAGGGLGGEEEKVTLVQ